MWVVATLSRLEKASRTLSILLLRLIIYLALMFAQTEANFPSDETASAPAPSSPLVIIVLIVPLSKATLNKATSSMMPFTGYANPGQSPIFNAPGLKSGLPSNGASASTTGKSSPEDLSTSIDVPTVIFQQPISCLNKSSLIVSGSFNLQPESKGEGGEI